MAGAFHIDYELWLSRTDVVMHVYCWNPAQDLGISSALQDRSSASSSALVRGSIGKEAEYSVPEYSVRYRS